MSNLYVDLDQLYEELNISVEDTVSRSFLAKYAISASRFVDSYCGRKFFYQSSIVEKVETKDKKFLILDCTPVISIASIYYDGELLVAGTDYELYDNEKGSVLSLTDFNRTSRQNLTRYVVTYSAGYKLPGAIDRDLPYDIQQATHLIVREMHSLRSRDPQLRKIMIPQVISEEYFGANDSKNSDFYMGTMLLKKYKRISL